MDHHTRRKYMESLYEQWRDRHGTLDDVEAKMIAEADYVFQGNKRWMAKALGICIRTMRNKMNQKKAKEKESLKGSPESRVLSPESKPKARDEE